MKQLVPHILMTVALSTAGALHAQGPEVTSWLLNTSGATGYYYTSGGGGTPISHGIEVNCQQVEYSTNNVYIHSTGIPAYNIGPYLDGNPAQGADKDYLFRIPRNPVENTGTKTIPGLGQIGVLINGVPFFNGSDGRSYSNMGIWNQLAPVAENSGFDCAKGHPSPGPGMSTQGYYHHHQNPTRFDESMAPTSTVCGTYPSVALYSVDSMTHSPLLGYAFDGFPVYGSFAYTNTDGTGGISRMRSSWQKRSITNRTTLPDGTVLSPAQYGPAIGGTYPLGYYEEDYEFVPGSGDLDFYNGRITVTPEYPAGIYCYFATIDEDWNAAYPYFIGPEYYGVVATDNFIPGPPSPASTGVVISEPTTIYTGTSLQDREIAASSLVVFPTPATSHIDVLSYAWQPGVQLSLMDYSGRLLRSCGELSVGGTRIDVSGMAAGTYLLRADVNGMSVAKVFVKQ